MNTSKNLYDLPEHIYDVPEHIYDVPDDKSFPTNTPSQRNLIHDEMVEMTSKLNTIPQTSPANEMKAYGRVPDKDTIPSDYALPTPTTSSVDALPPCEMQSNAAYAVNSL